MKKGSLKRLLSYTFRYKWSFFISVIGFISFAFADIAAVEWIRRIIGFINSEEDNFSTILALSLIFIALGRGIGFFIGNYFMSRVGFGVVRDLRGELFHKLHDLPKAYFDSNQSGQLINRITFTTTQVSGAASNAVKTLIREGFLLIGLFIYLLILNSKLTLLLIGTAPLIALIVYVAGKRLKKLAAKIQTAMGDVTHIASEAVDGHVEIKSFNAQEYENSRFLIANESNKNQNLKLEATGNMATPIIQVLVSISLSIVAYFALGAKLGISLDAETFVAFFTAAGLMAKPIRQLSSINMIVQKGLAAANEIFEQLDEEIERDIGETTKQIEGLIEFNDINFSYDTGSKILSNINFSIDVNETVAIVGKSGSGKSTIANLIPRFYNHTSGEILIDNVPVSDYSLSHLRSSISIVNQSPSLFNDTIAKNIAYGDNSIDVDKLKESAKLSGCEEFISNLPEGYESQIGDDGVLLSGGQRQRLAIARAFYKDSPIIILDEATSSLDTESELIVQEALEKLITNRTTIVIAHRLSTIENASKIIVLDDGKIVESGTHEELINNESVYHSLYKNKFEDSSKSTSPKDQSTQLFMPEYVDEPSTSYVVDSWYKKSLWLYLLYPFSLLFSYLTTRRRRKYIKNIIESYKPNVPIIVVGNLTIGGTGKTPLVKHIATELINRGYNPGIVSRGYGGKFKETLEVTEDTPVKETGDEAQILAKLNIPFYIDKNRVRAVKELTKRHNCDVIISDDGLQHYQMDRDIEIAVIDGKRRFGNNLTFPAGPLRESKKRLKSVDFIVNNTGPTEEGEFLMNISPSKFVHLKSGKSYNVDNWPMHKQIHAVAGLGNPGRFFDLLDKLGFDIIRHPFPDHHKFLTSDIFYLDHLPIVMTEKDASKCKDFDNNKIWFLTIDADVSNKFIDKLIDKLKSIK
ncbi:MAG: lipid ABC transporter permease [Gammaproteobacteria bacterium TMED226]|nr:MAG: lipid ABC transporter permease [Gammaproteobacteria bacterium TMED226]|tara:strand:+ start:15869 stop:18628 length:2760 start_codon:yes stop_codon:yes gene_type:complete